MLSAPTIDQLAAFTGRDAGSYAEFATNALQQATLLFSLVTRNTDMPSDPTQAALALNAILEMANRLYLEQDYAELTSSPFQSETIGSYTYSMKTSTALKASSGGDTGLIWWDLALDLLSAPGSAITASGSVGGGFDAVLGVDVNGRRGIRNPDGDADLPPYHRIS